MIRFLWKGLVRDRSRSLTPLLVIAAGAFLTVTGYCYMSGVLSDLVWSNAAYQTGHVKITTRAYAQEEDMWPLDLAILGVSELLEELEREYPQIEWTPRIRFGGLLDIPDERGETKSQAPIMAMAVPLVDEASPERNVLNLKKALVHGRLPEKSGEILISEDLAQRLGVQPGQVATFLGASMYGSMTLWNFTVIGTLRFGIKALDRTAVLIDFADAQQALEMEDAASEVLGFYPDRIYREERLATIAEQFNRRWAAKEDEFSLVMRTLRHQNGLAGMLDLFDQVLKMMIFIFVFIMSIVLWNAGLMGSLRRYGEIGVRLAMGESKSHVYGTLILESVMLGFVGAVIGTVLGLAFSYYLQVHGINISSLMQKSTIMLSEVLRSRVTPKSAVIGFIPGFIAPVLGTSLAGIGIYKRQTSQLFKELEV